MLVLFTDSELMLGVYLCTFILLVVPIIWSKNIYNEKAVWYKRTKKGFYWLLIPSFLIYIFNNEVDSRKKAEQTRATEEAFSQVQDLLSGQNSSGEFDFDFGTPIYDSTTIRISYGQFTGINSVKSIPGKWYTGMNFIVFSDGFEPIKFNVKNNRLVVSMIIYGLDGYPIVEIDSNRWSRNKNSSYKFNWDSKGFEIFDKQDHIACSVNLNTNNSIEIQGYLIDRKHNFIMIGGKELNIIGGLGNATSEMELSRLVSEAPAKQLFRYTGMHPLHSRLNNDPTVNN